MAWRSHSDTPQSVGLLWTNDHVRRTDLYVTTHNTHNRQTSMLPVGFEPRFSARERPQTSQPAGSAFSKLQEKPRKQWSSKYKHNIFIIGFSVFQNVWSIRTWLAYQTANCTRNLSTPWSTVLLEKLTGSAASQEIRSIFGTRKFITILTSDRHLSLSWASSIQSPQHPPTSWRSILILSSHLCLGLPNGLFPSGFSTITLCTLLPSPNFTRNARRNYKIITLYLHYYSANLGKEGRRFIFCSVWVEIERSSKSWTNETGEISMVTAVWNGCSM